MSLSSSSLSTKLQTEIGNALSIDDTSKLADVCDAIAAAIVDEITSNAVVAMANGGADTNGDSLVTNSGTVS